MDQQVAQTILDIQHCALLDPRYQSLLEEHEVLKANFQTAMRSMPQDQQDAVLDYFGVAFAMHLRLLELACEKIINP